MESAKIKLPVQREKDWLLRCEGLLTVFRRQLFILSKEDTQYNLY